jgi:2-keto-4-pentenoate hydratase/2-oxohepta-3-ene-1,7-dioic acid hydratase in catechol pathway
MRLAVVTTSTGEARCVAVVDEEIVDLQEAAPALPHDMPTLLATGPSGLEGVQAAVDSGAGRAPLVLRDLAPPVRPAKFVAVGLNYADHAAEVNLGRPEYPALFSKLASCVNAPYGDIERPIVSEQLDYEGELAFVIGRRCRHVRREDAHEVIAGYAIVNDVSVRDYQLRTPSWMLGKSFDTHGPIGPWIVIDDDLDPHTLNIRTTVNGEVRQQSNTSQLIFDCFELVEVLSDACTLEPGDVVTTGTPSGVGMVSTPPKWLVPGDVVRIEIEGIGTIENRVVQEPTPPERDRE